MSDQTERLLPKLSEREALDFRLIFAVVFVAFLLEAIGRRLLLRGARTEGGKSVIAEARAAACRCVPFAFMG